MNRIVALSGAVVLLVGWAASAQAQPASEADTKMIREQLASLTVAVEKLKVGRDDVRPVADVEVFAKAADWIVRHEEFFKPDYAKWTIEALHLGLTRAETLASADKQVRQDAPWRLRTGSTVCGYYSDVDGSVQPYVVTLPKGFDPQGSKRWPLHVELHGRGDTLNEVSFIHAHEAKPQKDDREYIQLDVFGRTNNAYRWAGETDVMEAIASVKRTYRIDDRRVTLRGFSMGGAGAWHLGLHHPSLWSSVGAGAGFCDTVQHLSLKEPLSPLHQKLTKIYDAQDYALNAFNVPTIGYGGELDKQLFASTRMHERGEQLGVPIPQLIGPQTEHKWHPESVKAFMAFHAEHTRIGRPQYPAPARIRFTTHSLKYNSCEWLIVEEQIRPYEASVIEAAVDPKTGMLAITTKNISVIQIMRDVAENVVIDGGSPLPLNSAAGGLLPGVYYELRDEGWAVWDYNRSHKYAAHEHEGDDFRKRHNLQGPIDDAFMQPFVCVRPTGTAWSGPHADWVKWTLARFEAEFDKRMRAKVLVVNDTQVTDELIETKHLILFGDPGSNAVLAKIIDKLPVEWTKSGLTVKGTKYDAATHGVALIYPNPLNRNRYVVVNSGHTFHEPEFKASNANLFPKLGDIAVIQFAAGKEGFSETPRFADVFDARWRLAE